MGSRQASSRCSPRVRGVLLPPTLFLLVSLQGCPTNIDPYPEAWPAPVATPENHCPDIRGRYLNAGAPTGGAHCGGINPQTDPNGHWPKASWNCDPTLAGNLMKMRTSDLSELQKARGLVWVELTQPDADTLEMHFPPESSHKPIVFTRKGGDFDCSGSSLQFSTTGSFLSVEGRPEAGNIAVTAIGLLQATGGIVSSTRSFRPLQDGSLSMEVTEVMALAHLIVFGKRDRAFVRWERALVMPVEPVEAKKPIMLPAPALIRSVQEGLRKVGYTWVPADGQLDACTRAAIRHFQNSSQYTGRFVDELPSEQLLNDIKRTIQKGASANQPVSKPDNCPVLTSVGK